MALFQTLPLLIALLLGVQPSKSESPPHRNLSFFLRTKLALLHAFTRGREDRGGAGPFGSFAFTTLDTRLGCSLPSAASASLSHLRGRNESCPCKLTLPSSSLRVGREDVATLCLYRAGLEDGDEMAIFESPSTLVQLNDSSLPLSTLTQVTAPVRGFIVGEPSSSVRGYVVNEAFYGSIKILDRLRGYYAHFYLEPFESLVYYDVGLLGEEVLRRRKMDNAIVFESVGSESDSQIEDEEEQEGDDLKAKLVRQMKKMAARQTARRLFAQDLHPDLEERVAVAPFSLASRAEPLPIFDLRSSQEHVYHTPVCLWITPNFAEKFALGGSPLVAVAEMVDILRSANAVLRGQDFNMDGVVDNLGLKIRTIILEEGEISPTQEDTKVAMESSLYPIMVVPQAKSSTRRRRRKRRIRLKDDIGIVKVPKNTKGRDLGKGAVRVKVKLPSTKASNNVTSVDRMIYTLTPHALYERLAPKLTSDPRLSGCGIVLGFVFHNLSTGLSVTNLRGACDPKRNLALTSGLYGAGKVGKFDLLRSVLHSLGHLFGSNHDPLGKPECAALEKNEKKAQGLSNTLRASYHNDFLMTPVPVLNVGLRPNSFHYSPCSKKDMAGFLSSGNAAACLTLKTKGKVAEGSFCGDGLLEGEEEECDAGPDGAGADPCCGASDSLFPCKKLGSGYRCGM